MASEHFEPNIYTGMIWSNLKQFFGNNEEATAGFMGNLYQESSCIPYLKYNESAPYPRSRTYTANVDSGNITRAEFIATSEGAYGLVQWYSKGRKENLYDGVWVTGGDPPSSSNSIGSIDRALNMIRYELTNSYSSVYDSMVATSSINTATQIAFDRYFIPGDSTLPLRQQYALEIYNTYGSGTSVRVSYEGNGYAYVDNPNVQVGENFTVYSIANTGETIESFDARTEYGQSIATSQPPVPEEHLTYQQVWGAYITVHVVFSGETPPPPPPPTRLKKKKHGLPIWAYPCFKV